MCVLEDGQREQVGMSIFEELLESVYHYFHEMKENKCKTRFDTDTLSKAGSLFKFVTGFSYITSLIITRNIIDYFPSVTTKLLSKNSDIVQSIDLITTEKVMMALILSQQAVQYCRGACIQTQYLLWNLIWLHQKVIPLKSIVKNTKQNLTMTIIQVMIA